MNLRTVRRDTLIALLILSAAACGRKENNEAPGAPSGTTAAPQPPSGAGSMPATESPGMPASAPAPDESAPGSTPAPVSPNSSAPASGMRTPPSRDRYAAADGTAAPPSPAAYREMFGVRALHVADGVAAGKDMSAADRGFLQDAAAGGMFETEVAQLALDRAQTAEVRTFARMLLEDHRMTNSDLKQFAASKNVALGAQIPADKRGTIEKLRNMPASEFDRSFISEIGVEAHEKDIAMFEKASKGADDREVRAWAEKTLPSLQHHLAAARSLQHPGDRTAAAPGGR